MQVFSKKQRILSIILVLLLVVCTTAYQSRSQTFSLPKSSNATFTNSGALKDWVSNSVYVVTLQRINYYLAIYNIPGTALTITDTPQYSDDGSLSFNFSAGVDSVLYGVTVQTTNYGDVSSSAVSINGKLVTYAAATSLYGAQFSDFDSLTSYGLTGQQVYGIQQALNRFAPNGTFDIISANSSQEASDSGTKTSSTISINGKKYQLVSTSSNISEIQFVLLNDKNKSVFDSGLISFSN